MPHNDPLRLIQTKPRVPLVLLTHPFELALGGVLVANGLRGFGGKISPSLAALPGWLTLGYLIVSTIGGVGVVVGLLLRADSVPGFGVVLERASLFLVAASYFTLAVAILQANGSGGVGVAVTLGVVMAACLLRAHAIRLAARAVLRTLTIINREAEK